MIKIVQHLMLCFHEILLHHFHGPVTADVTVSELHKRRGRFEGVMSKTKLHPFAVQCLLRGEPCLPV